MELDTVVCMEALDFLRGLPDGSVHLIATDPPYMNVKDEDWDKQWENRAEYLDWLRVHLVEFQRVLAPNGSLYLFASPQMAAWVEVTIADYFHVLTHITWKKPPYATKAEMFDKDSMRAYFPASESIIFAEQGGSESKYNNQNGLLFSKVMSPLIDYMRASLVKSGSSKQEINKITKTFMADHWFTHPTQWMLPTSEYYSQLQSAYPQAFNREYEDLRREYEDLRQEYEDLRRPFNVTDYEAYTDVWTFRTVQAYPGKHPCEKPLDLMRHIVKASSREGDVVLDPFCGSGATLDAARQLGRRFLGCDSDAHWAAIANKRLALPYTPPLL